MLQRADQRRIEDWLASIECRVALPAKWRHFFTESGQETVIYDDRRRFRRMRARCKGLIFVRGELGVCYIKDFSREGMAFLYHEQLFPGERLQVRMPGTTHLSVTVTRCWFVADACYEIGGRFASAETPNRLPALERFLSGQDEMRRPVSSLPA